MTDLGPVLLALAAQVTLPLAGGLLLSRRRDPAAACGPLTLAVATVLALTPLAFLPRPAWPPADPPAPAAVEASTNIDASPQGSAGSGGVNVLDLLRLVKPTAVAESPARFDPWKIGAWAVLGLAAFGLGRFTLGWVAVVRAVRRSRPIGERNPVRGPTPRLTASDPLRGSARLVALAEELRTALGCRRPVQLRESPHVGSAATTGWLRPVVLLSPHWQGWTPAETRAVLAHELAHVARGDFATRLLGRLAVAVHGYHPLVRWAANRLELRQEMAADARAADSCGGRAAYLKCLAALALKADAAPVGPVPTFLSRPKTLLRRIAMLRVTDDAPVRSRRWPALAAVALLAAAALGLHGTPPAALAGPVIRVKADEEAKRPPLDVSFVFPADDPDFVGVYAGRVGELLQTPGLDAMVEQYTAVVGAAFGEDKKTFFEMKDIDQVCGRVSIHHEPSKPSPNRALMLSLSAVRMAKDFDWLKQLREWCGDLKEHARGGAKYYSGKTTTDVLGPKDSTLWFFIPDGRTLVLESEANVHKLIDGKGKPVNPIDWDKVEGGTLAIALVEPKTRLAKKVMAPSDHKDETEKAVTAALGEIFAQADSAVLGLDVGKTCRLTLSVSCADRKDTDAVLAQYKALGKLALDGLAAAEKAGVKLPTRPSLTTGLGVESEPKPRSVSTIEVDYKGGLGELMEALK